MPGATACDRCYVKKAKCDRGDPCRTCVAANAVCQRARQWKHRRRLKPVAVIALNTLAERMNNLENLLHTQARSEPVGGPSSGRLTLSQDAKAREAEYGSNSTSAANSVEDETQETPDFLGRFLTEMEVEAGLPSTGQGRARDNSSQPQGNVENGAVMFPEMPSSDISLKPPLAVLETVLAALDQFSQSSSLRDWDTTGNANYDKSTYELSPSDIANILTRLCTPATLLYSPNFMLPWSTVKTMGLSLLDSQDKSDQKALHYRIILNFEAAVTLGRQKGDKHDADENKIQAHIEGIKRQKFLDVLAKLDQISFRTPPSLSLLQVQCIGVSILQYFGNAPQAWSMMVAVSRTFIALGFGNTNTSRPASRDEYIERCIAWCYQLDWSMSLLLGQPPLLPQLSSAPTVSLSSSSDETETNSAQLGLIQILLEFAHIQGHISSVTSGGTKIAWEDIQPVHRSLIQLYSQIENWKLTASDTLAEKFELDLLFLDFRYYATQTLLLQRCAELPTSSQFQRQIINCARKSLQSFYKLAQNDFVIDMVYMAWDILLYPLSPICVLAYNIICTENKQDLELIRTYGRFVQNRIDIRHNLLARRSSSLCAILQNMGSPLPYSPTNAATATPAAATTRTVYPTNHTPRRKNFMNFDTFFTNAGSSPSEKRPAGGDEAKVTQERELLLKILTFQPRIRWDYS